MKNPVPVIGLSANKGFKINTAIKPVTCTKRKNLQLGNAIAGLMVSGVRINLYVVHHVDKIHTCPYSSLFWSTVVRRTWCHIPSARQRADKSFHVCGVGDAGIKRIISCNSRIEKRAYIRMGSRAGCTVNRQAGGRLCEITNQIQAGTPHISHIEVDAGACHGMGVQGG